MIVIVFLSSSLRPISVSPQLASPSDSGKSDLEDRNDPARGVRRLSRRFSHKRESDSGSSAPEEEGKHTHGYGGSGVPVSGPRRRRSHRRLDSPDTNQGTSLVKAEADVRISFNTFVSSLRLTPLPGIHFMAQFNAPTSP